MRSFCNRKHEYGGPKISRSLGEALCALHEFKGPSCPGTLGKQAAFYIVLENMSLEGPVLQQPSGTRNQEKTTKRLLRHQDTAVSSIRIAGDAEGSTCPPHLRAPHAWPALATGMYIFKRAVARERRDGCNWTCLQRNPEPPQPSRLRVTQTRTCQQCLRFSLCSCDSCDSIMIPESLIRQGFRKITRKAKKSNKHRFKIQIKSNQKSNTIWFDFRKIKQNMV